MKQITVSEKAIRELVREALEGDAVIDVNDVIDPSAAQTNPINAEFVPTTRPELDVAVKQLTKDIPGDRISPVFKSIKDAIKADEVQREKDDKMKTDNKKKSVEETVRRAVRKALHEINPRFDTSYSGMDYGSSDDDDDDDLDPKVKRTYKATALGNMADVDGASFEEIATELGFSVAGAKQAVDKALEKAQFIAATDSDDMEIIVLTAMGEYIKMLAKTGELSAPDVELLKAHPAIVRELDGFRDYLHNSIRRARKATALDNPLGEAKSNSSKLVPTMSRCRHKKEPDMVGRILSQDGDEYYVQWDGGVKQRVPKSLVSISEAKMPPKCVICKKPLTLADKKQYESKGGKGYPSCHDDCAATVPRPTMTPGQRIPGRGGQRRPPSRK
jgi:hypothetical protein